MRVQLTATNVTISDFARATIVEQVEAGLARFAPDIVAVHVTISDENGPRGGVDHTCTMELRGRRMETLVARATGVNAMHAAILAARKMDRRVRRALGRAVDHRLVRPAYAWAAE